MAETKVLKRKRGGLTKTAVVTSFTQWVAADKDEKSAKARKEELRKKFLVWLEEHGVEDDKGHRYIELSEEVAGYTAICAQKRVSQRINDERAEAFLQAEGLWKEATVVQRVIDETKLASLVFEGKISQEQFDALIDRKETPAFVPVK